MSIDLICKNITKTYDLSSLLNIKNKNILEQFSLIVKDAIENPTIEGNRTLITLIYNYFYKEIPKVKYINGPNAISYHISKKYNKRIYLFYEAHGRVNNCNDKFLGPNIDINKYLNKLFSTTYKFIDFYVETSKTITSESFTYNTTDYINKVRSEFYNCVDPNLQCEWNNIRVHYSDIRNVIKFEDEKQTIIHYNNIDKIADLTSCLESSIIKYTNQPLTHYHKDFFDTEKEYNTHLNEIRLKIVNISNNFINQYNEILKYKDELLEYILLFLSPNIVSKLFANAKKIDIISKEIEKSDLSSLTIFMLFMNSYNKNPTLKNSLKYSKKHARNISKQLKDLTYIEKINNKDINIENGFQNFPKIIEMLNGLKLLIEIHNNYILPNTSCYMDIYTICRMFKRFKHKSKNIYQPTDIKNIIFYGGLSHSLNISIMLDYLGFETVYNMGTIDTNDPNTASRCLDMKNKQLDFKEIM